MLHVHLGSVRTACFGLVSSVSNFFLFILMLIIVQGFCFHTSGPEVSEMSLKKFLANLIQKQSPRNS